MRQAATVEVDAPIREPRVIVVPRPLAKHFRPRLASLYEERDDVLLIVDRRSGERRRALGELPSNGVDRRKRDRRDTRPLWSLVEMPIRTPDDPAAAGVA